MEHTKTHFQNHNHKNNDNNKNDRKREMKLKAKEMETMTWTTKTTTANETGGDKESTTTDEEEGEEDTSANTANTTTFKRTKTTEAEEFHGFGTTSETKETTEDESVSSQNFRESTDGATMSNYRSADEFIPIGERIAAFFNGTLMSKETQNGRGGSKGLRFCCSNSHEFTISFEKLSKIPNTDLNLETCKDIWCVKCHNFYYRCVNRAAENGAVVISKIFEKGHVQLTCRMNHKFKISIHRNPDKVWCQSCKKDVKNENKRQKEIEKEIKRQKEYEYQKKLFEESKKHVESNEQEKSSSAGYTMQYILHQVELKADFETKKFMSLGTTNQTETSVFQIYKVIYMPSEILQAFFKSTGDGLNSCFRKMAVLVHPDKNSHPLANRAFQKLSQAYNMCLNKDNSSS